MAIRLFGAISCIGAVITSKYAIKNTSRHLLRVKRASLVIFLLLSLSLFMVALDNILRYACVKGTATKIKYILETGTATSRNFVSCLFTFFGDGRNFTPSLPGANMFTVHIMKKRSERCVPIIAIECCNTGNAFALFFPRVPAYFSFSSSSSSSSSSSLFFAFLLPFFSLFFVLAVVVVSSTIFLSSPAKLAIANTIVKRLKYA